MLFYCVWSDDVSFLVDVVDEAAARAAALEHVGTAPERVRAIPVGVAAFDVHFDDLFAEDDEDEEGEPIGDEMVLEAVPHAEKVLRAIEDGNEGDLAEFAALRPLKRCTSEADGPGGTVVQCELEQHGDDVEHEAGGLTW